MKQSMTFLSHDDQMTCKSFCRKFINWLPPLFVGLLVLYTYYVYVVPFCVNYLKSGPAFYCCIIFYHILVFMFLWTFFETMLTVHRPIPDDFTLNPEEHDKLLTYNDSQIDLILKKLLELRQIELVTLSDFGKIRYCRHCKQLKPDRTHHCSTCERCILKMDHHCPWINNCVGFCNYKQFVLLLMYSTVMCMFYAATLGPYVARFISGFLENWTHIHLSLGFIFAVLSGLLVVVLLFYHLGLVKKNETTLESLHGVNFATDNITFDLGCSKNFVQVFGTNPMLWLVPLRSAEGNGHEFRVKNII